ncbi:3'(2'),5'-bisphosphate nucleotidase CysQ [Rheinheimera sp.]|uniref:3'(2'),5'-bisphosphate nucleotidase CysQ n=1 Tax=Rheinheimera sp. TaxID=1869214 RepID=UPI00307D1F0C
MLKLTQTLLAQVKQIAEAAGQAILQVYQRDFQVEQKDDDSPLTEADLAAHQLILAQLQALTPDVPVLSEEAADIPWSERQHWQEYWLVDPLDGTKEFIKRNGEFTVNIALVQQGEPVLGVIHAPVLDKTYAAAEGLGASRTQHGLTESICTALTPSAGEVVKVVGSRSHQTPEIADYLSRFPQHELIAVGSSLKFCLVAEGTAHLYPRLGPTMLWDTGAGHVIAKVAGAKVTYTGIANPAYHRENLKNPNFLVSAL